MVCSVYKSFVQISKGFIPEFPKKIKFTCPLVIYYYTAVVDSLCIAIVKDNHSEFTRCSKVVSGDQI